MKKLFIMMILFLLIVGCAKPTMKQYYLLNYQPDLLTNRLQDAPYPFTIRLRPFEVEKAYSKPNLVYRTSPYQLEYYGFRHWAVRPRDMMTDLIYTHLETIDLVDKTVRRLDEAGQPDYEISGTILAIEEYDSDETWFGHLKMRMIVTRLSDGQIIYNTLFDKRKIVEIHEPQYVVRTLSEITDFFASTLMNDLDALFSEEQYQLNGASDNEI